MAKKIFLYLLGYVVFFFPMINLFWSYKENLPFFEKEVLWFSVPVTIFGFICSVGVLIYQKYKDKKPV